MTVGSNSNVADNGMQAEEGRARIDRLDLNTRKLTPYATGLRNPNGLTFEPETGALWVAVNERDEIGSDIVPDYITSVKEGHSMAGLTAIMASMLIRGSRHSVRI